eukprot:TRINITY_DN14368_c0_g1_i1.p1 TRINITY_DN14368_c0_g1~~TRINITY_DN14368_c0_g1_i1.p1  ORF type:complete len:332 (-),score=42.62 TRINITY_DN14368_c0_g1_i1:256-1251(-)
MEINQQHVKNPLLSYIQNEEALKALKEDGYYVLKGVLSKNQCQNYVQGLWDYVENANPKIQRNEQNTWYKVEGEKYDPWPASWGGALFHNNGVGWCQVSCDVREQVAPVFEDIFGTQKLHCSRDGFNFSRPPRNTNEISGKDLYQIDVHFDQGSFTRGLACIQGSVNLIDQFEGDGCFVCIPGSHQLHDEIMDEAVKIHKRNLDGHNFYIITDEERQKFEKFGLMTKRIYVEAGDMILWRSDLAHSGSAATMVSDRFRAVVYVCMLPTSMTPQESLYKKQEAWKNLRTSTHWPNKEIWFGQNNRMKRFNDVRRPTLTQRQKQLFGIEPYCD